MKKIIFGITTLLLLAFTACDAQIKNAKTESVKIYGNCGMCEKTIENAGNVKKVASVDWDKNSKLATITYNAKKTNKEEILKRIALAGYDSEEYKAPKEAYAKLQKCCQYREDKMKEMSKDKKMCENCKQANEQEHQDGTKLMCEKCKQAKQEGNSQKHTSNQHKKTSENLGTKYNQLKAVFNNYFSLKDAMVNFTGKERRVIAS